MRSEFKNHDPFLIRIGKFWENFVVARRPWWHGVAFQLVLAATGFGVVSVLYHWIHIYTGTTTLVTAILLVLCGDALPALLFTIVLILTCDYFYIPPFKSIFDTRESLEHFIIVSFTATVVSLLVTSLRSSYRNSVYAKEQAEKAADAMEKMLALVSHDIRNPLTSVKMLARLVLRHENQPEKREQLATRIIHDLDRVDDMIQTLLDVSRLRAGQPLPLQFVETDLQLIVSEAIQDLIVGFGDRFVFSGGEPIRGSWSPDGLKRAIENLATNAMKYGATGSPISVGVRQAGDHALISVHNEGNEIPSEEQGRLFDIYQRGATGKQTKGWGLGLAQVKGIAEAHQGTVSVESGIGRGTTFTLRLPLRFIGSPQLPLPNQEIRRDLTGSRDEQKA